MDKSPIPTTVPFSVDVEQFMKLILEVFYAKKEVFLREIISNASDALDKAKAQSLSQHKPKPIIKITPDQEKQTLTIEDNGIGMTKQELITNLGIIAKSTLTEALLDPGLDLSLVGQFGIGFYSVFLVADKVTVVSKSDQEEDKQNRWESTGASGTFSVVEDLDNPEKLTRGTRIILNLKKDCLQFLEEKVIKEIVKTYSRFISYPIELQVQRTLDNGETIKNFEWVNFSLKPLWARKPETITNEEYSAFFKTIFWEQWENPLGIKHILVEGQLDYKAILFVPRRAPFGLFQSQREKENMKLYVKKIFVLDGCSQLVPEYLNFIKGVVDSDDLPLNISRDSLLLSKIFKVMRRTIVKKCLEMIEDIAEDKETYRQFYREFSHNVKLGVCQDILNRHRLVDFLRYYSSKSGDEIISLKEYVSRMKEGQKEIYFLTGQSLTAVSSSPFTEELRRRGYEVLYLIDPIDEYVVQNLKDYDGKKMRDCSKDELYLEIAVEDSKRWVQYEGLCKLIKDFLGPKIDKACVGTRMSQSPCALVTNENGWSAGLIRIYKACSLV